MAHLPLMGSHYSCDPPEKRAKKRRYAIFCPKVQNCSAWRCIVSLCRAGERVKGGHSLSQKENGPLLIPQEKGFAIASEQLEELQCLPIALPIARRCRVSTARRFASAPTTRCRSAHLVEVRSNSHLPPVATMRRAPAMPHSAGSLPPDCRHSRLTIVRRGCDW